MTTYKLKIWLDPEIIEPDIELLYYESAEKHNKRIEEWKLNGAFIVDANFGSLDWSTEDVVNIELTLRYDWALLNF